MKSRLKSFVKPVLVSLASQFGPHATSNKTPKLWVLMYHRILPSSDNRFQQEEPGMLVRPESFAMHLKEIKRNFDVMFLSDWVKAKQSGEPLPAKACAVTFDDGWLDNFEFALPALKAEAVPATLFAVAEKIGTDFQFWPNIVSMLLLNGAGRHLAKQPLFSHLESQLNSMAAQPSRDQIAHIIFQLKQRSDADIFNALKDINWRSLCPDEIPPALMNWEQLNSMQASGLVEIGSHTCTHRRLTSALTSAELEHEIVNSKKILQAKLNAPVELFCFPNGDYNAEALSLVETHYAAAVTTKRGINLGDSATHTTKLHELTRIGLHDEVSHTRTLLRSRLSGWV
ncbi:MAG TPA: polysaccharide deacetylase family protein [Cellvibrio sp.]|nr:polysaccharide deacetylase family protein [Cellvibrio sp.]